MRCPFCGVDKTKVVRKKMTREGIKELNVYVTCTSCNAKGPRIRRRLDKDTNIPETDIRVYELKAYDRWNMRK